MFCPKLFLPKQKVSLFQGQSFVTFAQKRKGFFKRQKGLNEWFPSLHSLFCNLRKKNSRWNLLTFIKSQLFTLV